MTLLLALVVIAALLNWRPLTQFIPSESFLAFALVGIAVTALFQLGKVG